MAHRLLQHFAWQHLRPDLQDVSKKFCELALELDSTLDNGDMKDIMMIRLLEAKDCAVRQQLIDIKNLERDTSLEIVRQHLYPSGTDHDPHTTA